MTQVGERTYWHEFRNARYFYNLSASKTQLRTA